MEITLNKDLPVKVYFTSKDIQLPEITEDVQAYLKDTLEYKGKPKETYEQVGPFAEQFLIVGLGDEDKMDYSCLVKAAYHAAKVLDKHKVKEATPVLPELTSLGAELVTKAIAEGFLQFPYKYQAHKEKKKEFNLEAVSIVTEEDQAQAWVQEVENIIAGVFVTRDLVNAPANHLTPTRFAELTVELFEDMDEVEVEVFDKAAIEKLGMKALLSVSQGSIQEPRFVVMKYLPNGPDAAKFALVGKGVTYDSGGYALKPAKSMAAMKSDMGGAGSVVGAMYAIAKNKLPHNVYAVFAATENMIGGKAFKNGDVISSMKGSTIEVGNTDAEGRIVLADAIYYTASELKPSHIIDLATLTGAAVYTFGDKITPIMTNESDFAKNVLAASEKTGEMMWEMPMTQDIRDRIKGDISDLSNLPKKGKGGGIQVAGAFLEYFAEDIPWLHMDIAGTSFLSGDDEFLPKYATGVPVKTLYQIIKDL